jgi:hypothetical protein
MKGFPFGAEGCTAGDINHQRFMGNIAPYFLQGPSNAQLNV